MSAADVIVLRSTGATATVALHGGEPRSWIIGGHEIMWNADPQHWARSAPMLFPVVGASRDGVVGIEGASYPMPQHGFARDSLFDVVEHTDNAVTLRLTDSRDAQALSISIRRRRHLCARWQYPVCRLRGREHERQRNAVPAWLASGLRLAVSRRR